MTARPTRPWLARADWREGVIHWKGDGRQVAAAVKILVAFALYLQFRSYAPLLWLLVLVGVTAYFVHGSWRERQVGPATFTFERLPFIAGSEVRGTIRVANSEVLVNSRLLLLCFRMGPNSDDDGPIHAIPAMIKRIPVEGEPGMVDIPVDIELPLNVRASTRGIFGITWELSIAADFSYNRRYVRFVLPVFGRDAAPFVQDTNLIRSSKREIRKALSVFDE